MISQGTVSPLVRDPPATFITQGNTMYKKSDWRILSERWFGGVTYIIQNRKKPNDVRRISAAGWEEMED